ncbi:hypothetical protein GCM10010508_03550 [Streptomyces naganishii JCM 4654]|uniref:Uncharacterized protein n=1 Tax=Streptomyces naganishii JCM 4654 TaxID=1306179 RepID=A0A918XZE1_9ACTN|nr:hypothetical protein GCM10010508_03550 [Streptomyces naganishii JCM 4654]
MITSHSTAQAAAHPGRSTSMNTTVPKIAQTIPHRLSQNRARRGLRAVVGSLPVRITDQLLPAAYPFLYAAHTYG